MRRYQTVLFTCVLGALLFTMGCSSCDGVGPLIEESESSCKAARGAGADKCDAAKSMLADGEAKAAEARKAMDEGNEDQAKALAEEAKKLCGDAQAAATSDKCAGKTGGGAELSPTISDDDLKKELEGKSPAEVAKRMKTIYFDYDKSDLRGDQAASLDLNARILKIRTDVNIEVGGHCDERGTDEYNRALGARRAESVKQALVDRKAKASQLKTLSYGEDEPAVQGSDESAWSKNRRAAFTAK